MSRLWSLSILVGLSIAMGGCSIPFAENGTSKVLVIEELKRTPAHKIIISELDILDRPYVFLSDVSVQETSWLPLQSISKETVNVKLQEEAYRHHADAIIFVTYTSDKTSWLGSGGMRVKGKAVKFKYY